MVILYIYLPCWCMKLMFYERQQSLALILLVYMEIRRPTDELTVGGVWPSGGMCKPDELTIASPWHLLLQADQRNTQRSLFSLDIVGKTRDGVHQLL
jgi:hypothetical protein